jgi:uncharacterized DUF497 family protein
VPKIVELLTEGRADHLARHGVTLEEAEEVAYGRHFIRLVKKGVYRLTGQKEGGRYLTVFVGSREEAGVYGLITARPATPAERRAYHLHID